MTDRSWALQRKLLRASGVGFNAELYNWFKDVDSENFVGRKALRDSLLIQPNEVAYLQCSKSDILENLFKKFSLSRK